MAPRPTTALARSETVAVAVVAAAGVLPVSAHGDLSGGGGGGLSPTAVGVLIVGVVVVLALLAILVWFMRRRNPKLASTQAAGADTVGRGETSPAFFMTAFSPPSSSFGKNADAYSGTHIDARGNRDGNPQIKAPTSAPYAAYGRQGRMPGTEPLLYNREATTTLRINDSTRSYLYEPTASPDRTTAGVEVTPKIFSSKNSVDFTYADTDRSNMDHVDSTPTALREFNDLHDSTRSNDTDPYAFVVESNNSSRIFSVDDDSARSSRLGFDDDSSRSSRPYSDASARTTVYNEEIETNILTTKERRNLKVEL